MSAADAELRWIERALHDGVQQDLIAVSVRLQLAQRLAANDLPAALALLAEIEADVRGALDRVRALANEVYPSILDARGLTDALRGAGAATEVEVTVDAAGAGRYPADIEAAVYFFCRAALSAAVAGSHASIAIREDQGRLRVVVECESESGHSRLTATVPLV
jgi:signal transduction histidine kinase